MNPREQCSNLASSQPRTVLACQLRLQDVSLPLCSHPQQIALAGEGFHLGLVRSATQHLHLLTAYIKAIKYFVFMRGRHETDRREGKKQPKRMKNNI